MSLRKMLRVLCEADDANIYRIVGDGYRLVRVAWDHAYGASRFK